MADGILARQKLQAAGVSTMADLAASSNKTVSKLATESAQTKYCVQRGSSCDLPDPAKVKIDAAYVDANTSVIREQLLKSGVRLAHLLDAALGK